MEHLRRYILTDWAGAPPFNSPCGLSTLKVRKFRRFRCVKIFCNPIHWPLEDGQTCCFGWQNQINFVFTFALFFAASTFKGLFLLRSLVLIVSAAKTCEVLIVSTGLAGWWVVRKTNAFMVKVMSWNLDEHWTAPLCFLCHAKAFPLRAGLIVHCCGHWLSSPQKVPHLLHLANPIICAFILVSNEENCRREILYIETISISYQYQKNW